MLFRSPIYSLVTAFAILLSATSISFAETPNILAKDGAGSGGGGDARCQEFYSIASDISQALVKIGQTEINQADSQIDVSLVQSKVEHLSVIPGKKLQRQAWSNSQTDVTQLDVKEWKKLDPYHKKKLVSHELMVLSGIEGDGEYQVSNDILTILHSHGFYKTLKLDIAGVPYTDNMDNTYTIDHPVAITANSQTWLFLSENYDQVCKFMGFDSAVGHSDEELGVGYSGSWHPLPWVYFNVIDSNGNITPIRNVNGMVQVTDNTFKKIRTIHTLVCK